MEQQEQQRFGEIAAAKHTVLVKFFDCGVGSGGRQKQLFLLMESLEKSGDGLAEIWRSLYLVDKIVG